MSEPTQSRASQNQPDHDRSSQDQASRDPSGQDQSPLAHGSGLLIERPDEAAALLGRGGVVALPTETVYGLAAVTEDHQAVARIFEIKGRPTDHPLIIHFAHAQPDRWVAEGWITEDLAPGTLTNLQRLAEKLWPGPLTLIVPAGPRLPDVVTGHRPSVGIRVPDHPLTTSVLELLDLPVAAPSANRYGRVSPTTADHVLDDLGGALRHGKDGILDGGSATIGVESAIVDLTCRPPQVLRPGSIPVGLIADTIGYVDGAAGPARASGMHAAHYAPTGIIELASDLAEGREIQRDLVSLGLTVELIDRSDDAHEAARHLYGDLRRANGEVDAVVFVLPNTENATISGVERAIVDRLGRAATGARPSPRRSARQ